MKPLLSLNLPKSFTSSAKSEVLPAIEWTGAVVFLFVKDYVLFIKRSETMPSHRGQIAFVGGHRQGEETPEETARREFEEETGLPGELIIVRGYLDIVKTSTRSKICPVVCEIDYRPEEFIKHIKSNGEWSDALLFPFKELKRSERWSFAKSILGAGERTISFFPLMKGSYLSHLDASQKDHILWGATAKMIWNFFKYYDERATSDEHK